VSVNAYGVYKHITFPLNFKVFKPKGTLKEGDKYKTKIELASEIITELINEGFNIERVLADSLYGESSEFLEKLNEYELAYVVAIRSNHAVWLPAKGLGRIDGVLLSEHLVIKSQRLDTLEK